MQLYEDLFMKILFDEKNSLLTTVWTEKTKDMTGPHFQGCLYIVAGFSIQKKSKNVVHDVQNFQFHSPNYNELVGPWRTQHISPLYNAGGVEKFAFLHSSETKLPFTNAQKMPNEDFLTKHFTSLNEMQKWLVG